MASFEEARRLVLANVSRLDAERAALLDAVGRVIAQDVRAPWPMPLCDNSAMDGYALRALDSASGAQLPVVGTLYAGQSPSAPLAPGTAIRIMTGAPLPAGADAVVPFEDAAESDEKLLLRKPVEAGAHVRLRGEDVAEGETVISDATLLAPGHISMIASCGLAEVSVTRRPRVAIVSTGDELVPAGTAPAPGQVIDSNSVALGAAIAEAGAVPVIIGIARDNPASHRERLGEGLRHDVLITSAGVSAGHRDLVRDVLGSFGFDQVFCGIDLRPGGPTTFGLHHGRPVFCLPGNPVASLITFEQFVRPALLAMMGHTRVFRPTATAVLAHDVKKKPGKVRILRVHVERTARGLVATSTGDQSTGILKTSVNANALAVLPADAAALPAGSPVQVQLLAPVDGVVEL